MFDVILVLIFVITGSLKVVTAYTVDFVIQFAMHVMERYGSDKRSTSKNYALIEEHQIKIV